MYRDLTLGSRKNKFESFKRNGKDNGGEDKGDDRYDNNNGSNSGNEKPRNGKEKTNNSKEKGSKIICFLCDCSHMGKKLSEEIHVSSHQRGW